MPGPRIPRTFVEPPTPPPSAVTQAPGGFCLERCCHDETHDFWYLVRAHTYIDAVFGSRAEAEAALAEANQIRDTLIQSRARG